jgi:hypothetical protein
MASESAFQRRLIREIQNEYPGAVILKNDPNYLQGFPDWLVLYRTCWAALEAKDSVLYRYQANQEYYVDLTNEMSYGSFFYPENKDEVLRELQRAFQS